MASWQSHMVMIFRNDKVVKTIAISALLFAVLVWLADFSIIDIWQVNPRYIAVSILLYLLMLCLRAIGYRLLAAKQGKGSNLRDFAKLAARHQFVFIVAPSGSGDLAFPLLAKKEANIDTATATGIILLSRLRDICTILGLGVLGLVGIGLGPPILIIFAILAFASMIWVEFASRMLAYFLELVLTQRISSNGWINRLKAVSDTRFNLRILLAIITLAIWACASAAIWFGFLATGYQMSVYECWVMIAGLNIVGALSVSLAGLGVVEAGATGVLMLFGETTPEAAAIAIVARLGLLLALVLATLTLEGITRFFFR